MTITNSTSPVGAQVPPKVAEYVTERAKLHELWDAGKPRNVREFFIPNLRGGIAPAVLHGGIVVALASGATAGALIGASKLTGTEDLKHAGRKVVDTVGGAGIFAGTAGMLLMMAGIGMSTRASRAQSAVLDNVYAQLTPADLDILRRLDG